MWDIEVNIAGYRFTHHAPDRRRWLTRPQPVRALRRAMTTRDSHAA